jgi:DNA-directed RNA polymerase specialized sigma24 family protein
MKFNLAHHGNSDSYNDKESDSNPLSNPDSLAFINETSERHPTPEMLLIRLAIDKALFKAQRELWYMYAYDKMTATEIGRKLGVSESSIRQRIKVIERKIKTYCKEHWEVYQTLEHGSAYDSENSGC